MFNDLLLELDYSYYNIYIATYFSIKLIKNR